MIPKRIAYCWFGGGDMPEEHKRYINGWSELHPGWEIMRIDESVFDPWSHPYARDAAERGQWSFVSDAARLWFLKNVGGFYLDTDVELYRSLDCMRHNSSVVCELAPNFYNGHLMACEEGFWPELFNRAECVFTCGKVLQAVLTEVAHDLYDLRCDDYASFDGVAFYGLRYSANARCEATPDTILRHHEANSWCGGWTPGFSIGDDVLPFNVSGMEGVDRIGNFDGSGAIGTVYVTGAADVAGIIDASNAFYNRRVVRVDGDGFSIIRKGWKRLAGKLKSKTTKVYGGLSVTCSNFDGEVLVAVDFDGTLTDGNIGFPSMDMNAINAVKAMQDAGASIILYTCREGRMLEEALQACSYCGLTFDYVNAGSDTRPNSRKVSADFYIDDRACIDGIDWQASVEHVLSLLS